ncbi:MAG: hypothetical protein ACRYF5_08225 [Janthinobacterium lividum]
MADGLSANAQAAARLLEGLALTDRTWLLAALAPHQRDRLAPWLDGAANTQVGTKAHLAAQAGNPTSKRAPALPDKAIQQEVNRPAEDAQHMAAVHAWFGQLTEHQWKRLDLLLQQEPLALTVLLLGAGQARLPWQTRFLDAQEPLRKRQLELAMREPGNPPAALTALLLEVASRALRDAHPAAPAVLRKTSPWQRLQALATQVWSPTAAGVGSLLARMNIPTRRKLP